MLFSESVKLLHFQKKKQYFEGKLGFMPIFFTNIYFDLVASCL